ncbi:MAG: plasmid replication initiator TrfA [Chloroflexi bacterium]|nr:plasmid replication initiator TrfA [Chloroflexota bacterium]
MSSTRKTDVHPAVARLTALAETAQQQPEAQEPRGPAQVIQLPLWPEAKRGAINAVLRSALFAAIQGKGRVALDRELVAAQHGIEIRLTGWQLTQSDLDVWEQALHLARTQALGTQCQFTERGFLKALGRQPGGRNVDWLKSAIARLAGAVVELTQDGRTYGGTLLEFYRDEDTGRTVLEINPKLAPFFGPTRWTQIDWEQRQQLRSKPLALWLHGFYASHATPYPLTVAYLHKLSGSQTKQLRNFKQALAAALSELVTLGAIRSFEIVGDLVHVWTVPSKSQQKHLAARRLPARRRK